MRDWTFWDWVGYSGIWIAALAVAADGAIKNSPELLKAMPQFFTGPIWPFVPLFFVLLGTVVLVAREFGWLGNRREKAPPITNEPWVGAEFVPTVWPSTPRRELTAAEKEERVFVGSSITAEYLIGFFRDHTGIQATKLTEAFIGKWMKVSGAVGEVLPGSGSLGGFAHLSFRRSGNDPLPERFRTLMMFGGNWVDRVAILKRGDEVTVIGKIARVDGLALQLENCELVDADSK